MMSMMHAAYAKQLKEHIYLSHGINLKRSSLIYGSIKPDASTIFAKYPHYIDKSLNMLCERIDMLKEVATTNKNVETRAFARELGVATHYISDYFCRVHNDINGIKHNESLGHVIYEQRLYKSLSKIDLDVIREEIVNRLEFELLTLKSMPVKQYILAKHRRYMKEAGKLFLYNNIYNRYKIDIKNSLEMVFVLTNYIIGM